MFNPPPKVRTAVYIITALGTPIIGYLLSREIIGELEVSLWGGLVTAVNSMAALNVNTTKG
jgi:hypothetical protein